MISFREFKVIAHEGKAERMQGDRLYALGREISVRISYALLRTFPRIRANHVSVANILVLVAVVLSSGFVWGIPLLYLILAQLFAVQAAAIGDRVDGEIARFKGEFTQKGIYYDRVFHVLFPVALYLPLSYFFAMLSGMGALLVLGVLLAALASIANTADNFRHSIKYKIALEGKREAVGDFYEKTPRPRPPLPIRIGRYLVFMMYDWVWALYVLLVLAALVVPMYAFLVYLGHTVISLVALLLHVLVVYPRRNLFSKHDIGESA